MLHGQDSSKALPSSNISRALYLQPTLRKSRLMCASRCLFLRADTWGGSQEEFADGAFSF